MPSNAIEDLLRHVSQCEGEFRTAPDIRALVLEDRFAIFQESRQELVEINATAATIWRRLLDARTLSRATEALVKDFGQDVAPAYLMSAVTDWVRRGWLLPTAVIEQLRGDPDDSLTLSVLDVGFRLNAHNCQIPSDIVNAFASLCGQSPGEITLNMVAVGEAYVLFVDRSPRGVFDTETLMPNIKAVMTALIADSPMAGFLAHGALVDHAGRRGFILGDPGAGKSTLSAALAQAGLSVLSDDIVQIEGGLSRGASFPIALKTGSWALFAETLPELDALPIYRRADGQHVRYLSGRPIDAGWEPLSILLSLDRRPGKAAAMQPLASLEAMKRLLASSYAAKGRISATQISQLAEAFAAMRCYTLMFSDLNEAVGLITQVLHDQA